MSANQSYELQVSQLLANVTASYGVLTRHQSKVVVEDDYVTNFNRITGENATSFAETLLDDTSEGDNFDSASANFVDDTSEISNYSNDEDSISTENYDTDTSSDDESTWSDETLVYVDDDESDDTGSTLTEETINTNTTDDGDEEDDTGSTLTEETINTNSTELNREPEPDLYALDRMHTSDDDDDYGEEKWVWIHTADGYGGDCAFYEPNRHLRAFSNYAKYGVVDLTADDEDDADSHISKKQRL